MFFSFPKMPYYGTLTVTGKAACGKIRGMRIWEAQCTFEKSMHFHALQTYRYQPASKNSSASFSFTPSTRTDALCLLVSVSGALLLPLAVVEARNLANNADFLSSNDPYVKIELPSSNQKFQTTTKSGAGKAARCVVSPLIWPFILVISQSAYSDPQQFSPVFS